MDRTEANSGTRAVPERLRVDEVGLQLVDLPFDPINQLLVVRAEMEVGQMDQPGHAA